MKSNNIAQTKNLASDIKSLIIDSKQQVAIAVNTSITILYWQIGKLINEEVLKDTRAEYGKQIVVSPSQQLELEYGSGWGEKQLRHYLRFADMIPDYAIVSTLWRQLSWSHIKSIIYINDDFHHLTIKKKFCLIDLT